MGGKLTKSHADLPKEEAIDTVALPTMLELLKKKDTIALEELINCMNCYFVDRNSGNATIWQPDEFEAAWKLLASLSSRNITCFSENLRVSLGEMVRYSSLFQTFVTNIRSSILGANPEETEQKHRLEELLDAFNKATEFLLSHGVQPFYELVECFNELLDFFKSPAIELMGLNKEIVKSSKDLAGDIASLVEFNQQDVADEEPSSFDSSLSVAERSNIADELIGIQRVNIIPNKDDLLETGSRKLNRNIIGRPFPDLGTYINIHFRLLIEDVMQPLRKGIANARSATNERIFEVRLYENARFCKGGMVFDEHAIPDCESAWRCYRITFQPPSNVYWERSKRLIHGALVCLWDGGDEFITGITTYSTPQSLSYGEMIVAFGNSELSENYLSKTYVMIESAVFFEPYRVVLEALRSFTPETFPLKDYILGHMTTHQPPRYLQKSRVSYRLMNTRGTETYTIQRPLELNSWPSARQLGLDEKQHLSLITALTSQVSLVQGPPGTGKTFLALQIVKTLLDNASLWRPTFSGYGKYRELRDDVTRSRHNAPKLTWKEHSKYIWKQIGPNWHDPRAPVLVVCLTNHALDQFLEGILKWTDSIIRIGGRSKSEVMKKYNLAAIKKEIRIHEHNESNYPYYVMEMQAMRESMKRKLDKLMRETGFLKAEVPSVESLEQRNIIGNDVASFFMKEIKENGKQRKDGRSRNPLMLWLGWENHNLLKRAAREMRLNLSFLVRTKKEKKTKQEEKVKKIQAKKANYEHLSDDDASDVIDDLSDDDFDEGASTIEEDGQAFEAKEEDDEIALVEEELVDDSDYREFKEDQKSQLEEIRSHLCNLFTPDSYLVFDANRMGSLPLTKRWQLFSYWRRCYRDAVRGSVKNSEENYKQDINKYKELKGRSLAALCRGASVVGMTTTGAAKSRQLLEALRCKIVVVEEAAEVLESHVICSLTSDCQQLIMIGDHQQLRPSVNVHELQTKYRLDVSLFERLIEVGVKPNVLGVQHRMRPEIARLITPAIYPDLKNADSVHNRPSIPGIMHDVYFFHHEHPEGRDGSSYFNQYEVEMALGLAAYIVRQGLPQESITILATYASQLHKLQDARHRRFNTLRNVRITVVDNFQGEENEVIILSLVRNNTKPSIGFLATPNRVCVALSRARCGFYMLGNMQLLSQVSPLWSQLNKVLSEKDQIGPGLPLSCARHRDSYRLVTKPDEFRVKKEFCKSTCGFVMQCDHRCPLKCHDGNVHKQPCSELVNTDFPCGHVNSVPCEDRMFSRRICKVTVKTDSRCGHWRDAPCYLKEVAPCNELVPKLLLCGHSVDSRCSIPSGTIACSVEVPVKLACSHAMLVPCDQRTKMPDFNWEKQCKEMVSKKLPCGHTKRLECREEPINIDCKNVIEKVGACGHKISSICHGKGPDDLEVPECREIVQVTLPCGHSQKGPCFSTPGSCQEKVERELECGHKVRVKCCEKSPPCGLFVLKRLDCGHEVSHPCGLNAKNVECEEIVQVPRPSCGHLVSVRCRLQEDANHLDSIPCSEETDKELPCGHRIKLPCATPVGDFICKSFLSVQLNCKHEIQVPCSKRDGDFKCKAVVSKELPCGHYKEMPCLREPKPEDCEENVLVELPCKHSAKKHCRARESDLSGHQCEESALKELPCGHFKMIPCFKEPNTATCIEEITVTFDCGHTMKTACGRKGSASCNQPIKRELPCGHKAAVPCGYLLEDFECESRVSVDLPCGHQTVVECCRRNEKRKCMALVSKTLPCKHSKGLPCYKDAAGEECSECASVLNQNECGHATSGQCTVMVTKKLPCGHLLEMPCYRNSFTELCKQLVVRKLDCGHTYSEMCGEASKMKKVKCGETLIKPLPCGHTVKTKCHKSGGNFMCNQKMELALKCGHTIFTKCSASSSAKCDKILEKELPCRHVVKVQCGSFDAAKPVKTILCRERVKKKIPGCGHGIECECGKNPSKKDCENRCNKKLKCGHLCKLKCKQDCSSALCQEMIDLSAVRRPCGHVTQGPCHLRYADQSTRNSWINKADRCTSTCGAKLDCGHSCPGVCSECVASHSHAVCHAPCNRTLVCGHKCEAKCSVACPPCKKRCTYRCVHGPCTKPCCDDYSDCQKHCAWKCPHLACDHNCSELCSREPCNNPCTKTLGCGHACIGLCGELCPPKCPTCSNTAIEDFNENQRYIYLECGHWIEVKRMDCWIFEQRELDSAEEDSSASKLIQPPSCPDCKKPVIRCFRYGDVIKNYYFDLTSVKYAFVRDVPNDDKATIKALKTFLGDRHLAAVHPLLEKFVREAESVGKGTREQLWDRANRSSLMYEWCCLLSDVKKMYTFCVRGKKYQIQLELSDTGLFFNVGLPSIKKIAECHSCGPEFCSNLSDLCTRLDYVRQILLVKAASLTCNVFKREQMMQAVELSGLWNDLDDEHFEFLDSWLKSVPQDSGLKLESSVKGSRAFNPRLSICEGVWKKCCNEACGDVFATIRYDECPSC